MSEPILVVAKDYFTYHRWLNTKKDQKQYIFVEQVSVLDAYPEADGLLIQDWANRPDAAEIWQWIEDRKKRRMENADFINDLLGGSPNGV